MDNTLDHVPTDRAPDGPPMQSPAPILAAVAAIAILVLTGLMATEFIWSAQHPVAVAHTPAAAPAKPG